VIPFWAALLFISGVVIGACVGVIVAGLLANARDISRSLDQ